jgi:hypothetical protein
VRNHLDRPPLSVDQILAWADSFYARHGEWPRVRSGPIEDPPGETWGGVQAALQKGNRGLPGGSSLALLIPQHRHSSSRAVPEGSSRPTARDLWPQVEDPGAADQTEAEAWRHERNQHSGRKARKDTE